MDHQAQSDLTRRWSPRSAEFVTAFGTHLCKAGHLNELSLKRATRAQIETDERFDYVLTRLGLVSDEVMLSALGSFLGLDVVQPSQMPDTALFPDKINVRFLETAKAIPVSDDGQHVVLALADPFNSDAAAAIAYQLSRAYQIALAQSDDIVAKVRSLYGRHSHAAANDDAAPSRDGIAGDASKADGDDVKRLRDLASEAPVIQMVHDMISRATALTASDIHLEPQGDSLHVRFRIDGQLRTIDRLQPSVIPAVTSRIKIMANLNIAERRLPQGGRIKTTVKGRNLDLRVSTMPTIKGESIVLRILDRSSLELDFTKLGMSAQTTDSFTRLLALPNGIVLVSGPTGSGKTTTLYTALNMLNRPESKIFSIEDPIEYVMPGINQIQVQPAIGLDFADVLRSVLRQDPDVIMVGEIRDRETASIAIQAALTGHLVLSTVHTNSAAAAVARLLDMGVENYLLASSLKGVLSQRLVRNLCGHCVKSKPLDPVTQTLAREHLRLDDGALRVAKTYEPSGCDACGNSGFRGRTMIDELLIVDDLIQDCIMRDGSEKSIAKAASTQGRQQMFDHGLSKVLDGITSLDDVLRVTRADQ